DGPRPRRAAPGSAAAARAARAPHDVEQVAPPVEARSCRGPAPARQACGPGPLGSSPRPPARLVRHRPPAPPREDDPYPAPLSDYIDRFGGLECALEAFRARGDDLEAWRQRNGYPDPFSANSVRLPRDGCLPDQSAAGMRYGTRPPPH